MIIPPLIVLALAGRVAYGRLQPPPPDGLIDAPDRWVPFQADVLVTSTDGLPVHGRYYRASDGSFRLETGPDFDDIKVISIKNASEGAAYLWSEVIGWATFQSITSSVPPRFRENSAMRLHEYRLAFRPGESGSTQAVSGGFEVYVNIQGSGVVAYSAPALNFHRLLLIRPDGRYEKHYNVEITEPDRSLFRPPFNAVVAQRDPPQPPDLH